MQFLKLLYLLFTQLTCMKKQRATVKQLPPPAMRDTKILMSGVF